MKGMLCALKWYWLLSLSSAYAGGAFAAAARNHVSSLPVSDVRTGPGLSLSCAQLRGAISCQVHVRVR